MKTFAIALLGLLCAAPCARAELLDTVTFNPARLGQYERLKVSDALTSPGGVQTQSLTVSSSGTVSVDNAGSYQVEQTQAVGAVDMPSTRFETPQVYSQGGAASFESLDEEALSHIENLTHTALKVKANRLNVNRMSVSGANLSDYDGRVVQGLVLGGNDIAAPDASCQNMKWFERTADDGNIYKVLGMATCGGAAATQLKGNWWGGDSYPDWDNHTGLNGCGHYTISVGNNAGLEGVFRECISQDCGYPSSTCNSTLISRLGTFGNATLLDPTEACEIVDASSPISGSYSCDAYVCDYQMSYSCGGNATYNKPYLPCHHFRLNCYYE